MKPLSTAVTPNGVQVAPPAGAWIETTVPLMCKRPHIVAPPAGAWIETELGKSHAFIEVSLPPRERGLKHQLHKGQKGSVRVAPPAGAWIETGR